MAAVAFTESRSEERQFVLKNTFLQLQDSLGVVPTFARPRSSTDSCISIREESLQHSTPDDKLTWSMSDDETEEGQSVDEATEFLATDDESSYSYEPAQRDSAFERTAKANVRLLREGATKFHSSPGISSSSSSSSCGSGAQAPMMGSPSFFGMSGFLPQPMMSIIMIDPRQQASNATESSGRKLKQRSKLGKQVDKPNKGAQEDARTTVMLRNLPRDFSRDALLKLLDDNGFACKYNFAYMPIDFVRQSGLGYAFVNLTTPAVVPEFWSAFDGFSAWPVDCDKVCRVNWSSPHQGYEEHVQRYRNSPMMHKDVPDACRPVLLENGVRVDFPPPTKALRPPRLRAARQHCPFWDQEQQEHSGADGEARTEDNGDVCVTAA
jgi:hypothetical protein